MTKSVMDFFKNLQLTSFIVEFYKRFENNKISHQFL